MKPGITRKVLAALAVCLAMAGCGVDGTGSLEIGEDSHSDALSDSPVPGIWYGVGGFGFDLNRVSLVTRRSDLDGNNFGGPILDGVREGFANLNGTTYAVIFGVTRTQFFLAPPGSVIWKLNI